MADPRFFKRAGPFTLGELAEVAEADIGPGSDPAQRFSDVAPLSDAGADDVSFLDNKKYTDAFSVSAAGACIVDPALADRAPDGMALLLSTTPYRGYARIAAAFYPLAAVAETVSPAATVDGTATLGEGCRVDPGAVIGPGAEIGRDTHVGANAVIGAGVVIGEGSIIGANTTIQYAVIGARCIVHPGAGIGQDGFGFAPGGPPEGHLKVPQLGRVLIGDDVEIGANTTVDRGTGPDTVIGRGTKIDNQCQIAHNVVLGEGCFLASQVGISGSTKIGNYVMIGGKAGFAGHLTIGDGAQMSGHAAVFRDVEPGQRMVGMPAIPERQFWRQVAVLKKMTAPKTTKKKKDT